MSSSQVDIQYGQERLFRAKNESGPSESVINGVRWGYFGFVCVLFALGFWNVIKYLWLEKRWKAFPLLLMYIMGQLTLIFAIFR